MRCGVEMKSWNPFAYIASCDLRESIRNKNNFAQLLNRRIESNKKKSFCLDVTYAQNVNRHENTINDNGIGLNVQFTDKIFDHFKRSHNESKHEVAVWDWQL